VGHRDPHRHHGGISDAIDVLVALLWQVPDRRIESTVQA
jgi:hypothetical protein